MKLKLLEGLKNFMEDEFRSGRTSTSILEENIENNTNKVVENLRLTVR